MNTIGVIPVEVIPTQTVTDAGFLCGEYFECLLNKSEVGRKDPIILVSMDIVTTSHHWRAHCPSRELQASAAMHDVSWAFFPYKPSSSYEVSWVSTKTVPGLDRFITCLTDTLKTPKSAAIFLMNRLGSWQVWNGQFYWDRNCNWLGALTSSSILDTESAIEEHSLVHGHDHEAQKFPFRQPCLMHLHISTSYTFLLNLSETYKSQPKL